MSKNLDKTIRIQSEKKRQWIRKIRGERLQGITEGTSSAPSLASFLSGSFPGINKSRGTHCGLIKQEQREKTVDTRDIENKRKDGEEDRARVR